MISGVCIYCSSSEGVAPHFFEVAEVVGATLAEHQKTLVFGGSDIGLMGRVARSMHRHGGKVIGVIPQSIYDRGLAYYPSDELIVTPDLRTRKAVMDARSDAFITLPGGFGTLEELFEILTLKQIHAHNKPIVILNTEGYYDPLLVMLEHIYEHRFALPIYRELYHVAETVDDAITYLESYQAAPIASKWE